MNIVDGDRLIGVASDPPTELAGSGLVNSEITLSGPRPGCEGSTTPECRPPQTYHLIIKGYADRPFWTSCAPGDLDPDCAKLAGTTPVYAFQVTTGDGGCAVLCEPGIADSDDDLAGTAVVFRGDVYDETETGVKIRSVDGTAPGEKLRLDGSEDDQFNIACVGTAVSKLHFLRHTSASMIAAAGKTQVAARQSMLQLLTGDYCGNGILHTINGLPLQLDYNHSPLRPVFDNVGLKDAKSVDALWSGDGSGALCLGTPRLTMVEAAKLSGDRQAAEDALVNEIAIGCPAIPRCTPAQRTDALNGIFGGYAISANGFTVP
jgi:hypothetical protein